MAGKGLETTRHAANDMSLPHHVGRQARALAGAAMLVAMLAACGGHSSAPDADVAQGLRARAGSGGGSTAAAASVQEAGAFLDWAEARFPDFFPGPAGTNLAPGLSFRFYPETGNYTGVTDADAGVYVLGPATGNQPVRVGTLDDFGCLVQPARCPPTPPPQTYVADIGGVPLRAPQPASFDAGSTFTLEGWLYLSDPAPRAWIAGKARPINGGAGGATLVFGLMLDDAGQGLRLHLGPDATVQAPAALPLRAWSHVAAVFDQGRARLYVNGALIASQQGLPQPPTAPTVPFGLGAVYDENGLASALGEALHARQWRFWRTARTASQIVAAMPDALPAQRQGLVAAWPLDDRSGTSARDAAGLLALTRTEANVGMARRSVLEAGPFFEAQTVAMAAGTLTDPSDLALIDANSDGRPDLFVAQVAFPPTYPATERAQKFFRNVDGQLVEATAAVLGDLQLINPRRLHVADFDGDSRGDLFIAETGTDTFPVPGAQSRLLLQTADGRLVDRSSTRLPQRNEYTHGLAVGDIDGNGSLDVFMGNYQPYPLRLLVNNGRGTLTDAGATNLPASVNGGQRSANAGSFCDLNGDGRPELVISADYYAPNGPSTNRPNEVLVNDGHGRFSTSSSVTLPPKLHGIEGVTVDIACADLDGDGSLDLLLATDRGAVTPGLQLLLNDGHGRMRDASGQLGVRFASTDAWVSAIRIVDLNGDGVPDVVLRTNSTNYAPRNFERTVLLGLGGGQFVDASEAFNVSARSGIAVGDIDGDGRLDLVTLSAVDRLQVWRSTKPLDVALFRD